MLKETKGFDIMKNTKRWIATILTVALATYRMPTISNSVFAEEADTSIIREENRHEDVPVDVEEKEEEKENEKEEISALQYLSEDGKWMYLEEGTYYSKISKLRFVITAPELVGEKTAVTISSGNQSETYKIEENGKLKHSVSENQNEFILDLDLDLEKWKDIIDYKVTVTYTILKEEPKKEEVTETTEPEENQEATETTEPEVYQEERETTEPEKNQEVTETTVLEENQEEEPVTITKKEEEKSVLVGDFHMLQQGAKLEVSCDQAGKWVDQDVSVQLSCPTISDKIPVLFYVKKPNEKEFSQIAENDLAFAGEGTYTYKIRENSKGDWAFRASYDLKYIGERIFSEEQKVDIRLDKVLPNIKVEQNKTGWTNQDVVFSLSNEADNISEISYYVKKNEEDWKLIEGKQYMVSEDESGNQYQFKVVSEVGEDSSIYKQDEQKKWLSTVYTAFVDKTIPKEAEYILTREEGDTGTGNWYGKSPKIQFHYTQDEGSEVALYYRIYADGETEHQKYKEGETITLSNDGKYTLEYYTEDEAGNRSKVQAEKIYLDTTKPKITDISFFNEKGEPLQLLDIISYPYITNKKVLVKVTASDNLSGVDKIVYQSSDGKQIKKKTVSGQEIQFTITPDFKGTLQVYCIDKLGNISNTKESEGLISEAVKPSIQVEFNKDIKQWHKSNIKCKTMIEDYDAGISKIICKYAGETIKEVDYSKKNSLIYKKELNLTLIKEADTKEGNKLEITVYDNAGNVKKITKNIYIDKTKPVITAEGVEEEKHYKNPVTMHLTVEEDIYPYTTVDIQVERMVDGAQAAYPAQKFVLDDIISQKSLSFSEDGTYTITINATDKAQNKSETIRKKFVVDRTAPVIEISGVKKQYYGKNVDLNIQVVESNYKDDEVNIEVTKTLEGKKSKVDVLPFQSTGKSSAIQKILSEDGDYVVKVTAQDKAGNKAKNQTVKFTVDKTAPQIVFEGVKEKQVTSKNITLKSMVKEWNYLETGANISIIREDMDGAFEEVVAQDMRFTEIQSKFDTILSKEGIYTAKITAKDRADNKTKKEITFTIDKSAPQIGDLEQYDGKYLSAFSWNQGVNDFVKDLTVVENHVYLNGEEKIGNFTIEQDGKYVLEWMAKDQLEHESKKKAEFIVDSTAPEITAFIETDKQERISLEKNISVYEGGTIKISLADKEDWIKQVRFNGNNMMLKDSVNQYEIAIREKGTYPLEIQAVDFAGNESTYQTQIKYEDKPSKFLKIAIPVGIILALLLGGTVVFWKGRRKKEE